MTLKVLAEERFVINRAGKFRTVVGPGIHIIIPFLDKARKIVIGEYVSRW